MLVKKDTVKLYNLITTRFRNLQASKLITDELNSSKKVILKDSNADLKWKKNSNYYWIQAVKIFLNITRRVLTEPFAEYNVNDTPSPYSTHPLQLQIWIFHYS